MLGRPGDLGDHLHAAGAGADHADALAGHVDPLGGPAGGVVLDAGERLGTGDRRLVHLRQAAGRGDQVAGRDRGAIRCVDDPAIAAFVESGPLHPDAEPDVAPQVEAVGDVVEVALQLRLGGEPLGPVPLLLQLLGERVAVVPALHVAAGAGIAVPVPRPADAVALLEHPRPQPQPAQPVQHVQPGRPGADDDRVEVLASVCAVLRGLAPLLGHRESRLPVGSIADGETSGASEASLGTPSGAAAVARRPPTTRRELQVVPPVLRGEVSVTRTGLVPRDDSVVLIASCRCEKVAKCPSAGSFLQP